MRGILLLAVALAAGCGFHLAGSNPAPAMKSVAVRYQQPYQVIPPPLIDALRARLGTVPGESAGLLTIESIQDVQRVLAISPRDGNAVAFELVSTVVFDFSADGKTVLQNQSLSARRAYSFDLNRPLAAEAQRQELRAAIHQALADQILIRLYGALAP